MSDLDFQRSANTLLSHKFKALLKIVVTYFFFFFKDNNIPVEHIIKMLSHACHKTKLVPAHQIRKKTFVEVHIWCLLFGITDNNREQTRLAFMKAQLEKRAQSKADRMRFSTTSPACTHRVTPHNPTIMEGEASLPLLLHLLAQLRPETVGGRLPLGIRRKKGKMQKTMAVAWR